VHVVELEDRRRVARVGRELEDVALRLRDLADDLLGGLQHSLLELLELDRQLLLELPAPEAAGLGC
jgi:hypothetical protein